MSNNNPILNYLFGGLPLLSDMLLPHLTMENYTDVNLWERLISAAFERGDIPQTHATEGIVSVGLITIMERLEKVNAMLADESENEQ